MSTFTVTENQTSPMMITKIPTRQNSLEVTKKRTIIDHPRIASYAFAFDIDGVLMKGSSTVPEAPKALQMLNGNNKYNITVPYIFVTNGGGRTEELRCEDLSKRLEVPVLPEQFIQGHTPMKDLVGKFETVLVVGGVGEACRQVAHNYGFRDVVTPGDILKWNPNVSPFRILTDEESKNSKTRDFSKVSIGAILVFADSREWASDQQIILELLMSKNGLMGTTSENHNEGPPIYFAHNDFVWSTNYNLNRIGMGALCVSLCALYQAHTGKPLDNIIKYGKPHQETFAYAKKVLTEWRQESYETRFSSGRSSSASSLSDSAVSPSANGTLEISDNCATSGPNKLIFEGELEETREIQDSLPAASTVYFVGDTPESDIRFANTFDKRWHSILVKTGVYQDGTEPAFKPKTTCTNVLDAVEFAIEREHEKEVANFNKAVENKVELPVSAVEELHPHILEELLSNSSKNNIAE